MNTRPNQSSAPWRLAVIAGLAGLVIGYSAARFQDGAGREQSATEPAGPQSPTNGPARVQPLPGPLVSVRITRAGSPDPLTATGLLIQRGDNPTSEVLLPLPALSGATTSQLNAGADAVTANTVTGVHAGAGLALLETGLTSKAALRAPASGASLYLGLELDVLSAGARGTARVETIARQRTGGQSVHGIRLELSAPSALSALVLPDTGELAGILTGRRMEDGTWEAIDAYAIQGIEPPLSGEPSVSVTRFGREFFQNTPAGRRLRFYAAAGQSDWADVIETGGALLETTPDDPDIRRILEHAYSARVRSLLEQNRTDRALTLLDGATSLMPDSDRLIEARAAVLHAADRPGEAAQALLRLTGGPPTGPDTRRALRKRLLALIDDSRLTPDRRRDLLQQAIERDSGHAPYHAELGETLYEQRRYAEALSRWNYAAQLDPALRAPLERRMDDARRRLDGSAGVAVPLISNGHSHLVDATVNHLQRRLLLDTGASFSAISPGLAESLGIDYSSATRRVRLSTANGVITAPVVGLQRIDLNGAEVRNLEAVVLEQLDRPGVLGLNFLNHFNIDIDQAGGQMTLRR